MLRPLLTSTCNVSAGKCRCLCGAWCLTSFSEKTAKAFAESHRVNQRSGSAATAAVKKELRLPHCASWTSPSRTCLCAGTPNEEVQKLIEPFVYEWTAKRNGSISAEHGLGQMKAEYIG